MALKGSVACQIGQNRRDKGLCKEEKRLIMKKGGVSGERRDETQRGRRPSAMVESTK